MIGLDTGFLSLSGNGRKTQVSYLLKQNKSCGVFFQERQENSDTGRFVGNIIYKSLLPRFHRLLNEYPRRRNAAA